MESVHNVSCPKRPITGKSLLRTSLKGASPTDSRPWSGSRWGSQAGSVRTSLARLPADFCWNLLGSLLTSVKDQLNSQFASHVANVVRRRDVKAYYELESSNGLQCISRWQGPVPGNPAAVHMLVSAFRKCSDLSLASAKDRHITCLSNVLAVDSTIPTERSEWYTDRVYQYATYWIKKVLGPAPVLDAVAFSARHGPGSTASNPYAARSSYFKYASWPYRSTPSALSLLTGCIRTDSRWEAVLEDSLRRCYGIDMWRVLNRPVFHAELIDARYPYNVVTTVPKDGRKDRPIAKEQLGNIYLQLGVGKLIRKALRLSGIDLNRQALVNRSMALESSKTKRFFTLDLSNASDTVGYDLVKVLLPADWFQLLVALRSPWGTIPRDRSFLYRKFSSMGNGYTFELETLIFAAISRGISRTYGHPSDRFATFGDDIIGPDYLYSHHVQYLSYSGFQVNSEKSFHGSSRVRESCGVDAFDGRNIRPFFVKEIPQSVCAMIGLRNRVRAWFLRILGNYPVDLDSVFLRSFDRLPPIGPDSDVEFDGWLQDGPMAVGVRFKALVPTVTEVPARELGFRKLMHSLSSCDSEGGNFLVSEPSDEVRLVGRVVDDQFDWLDY